MSDASGRANCPSPYELTTASFARTFGRILTTQTSIYSSLMALVVPRGLPCFVLACSGRPKWVKNEGSLWEKRLVMLVQICSSFRAEGLLALSSSSSSFLEKRIPAGWVSSATDPLFAIVSFFFVVLKQMRCTHAIWDALSPWNFNVFRFDLI